MRKGFVIVFIFHSFLLNAQVLHSPVSNSYTRLATYSRMHHDVFSFAANPAALSTSKNFSAGVYGERKFMLQELTNYSAALVMPTSSGNFGFRGNYFGSALYNESLLSLAYARKLSDKFDAGVQFNYNTFKASSYGSASAITFDAGLIFHLTEQLHTGVLIYNPTSAKMGKQNEERLPAIFSAGLGYDVSDKFFLAADFEKAEDQPINVHAGVQYLFDERILARTGISTSSSSFYFGAGFYLKDFRIDITASVHPHLGVTPGMMLIYSGKN